MRLTIIVPDKMIRVDNQRPLIGISTDWSWVPDDVRVVQWYDTWGQVEYNDGHSEKIEDLGDYAVAEQHYNNESQRWDNIEAQRNADNDNGKWGKSWEELLRHYRTRRLQECDWTQLPGDDNPLTSEKKSEWASYRTLLRNLPSSVSSDQYRSMVEDSNHELWPTKPA